VAWLIWLVVAVSLVQLTALPQLLKVVIAAAVVTAGCGTLWRFVFLRGSRGCRALEWSAEEGLYYVYLGGSRRRLAAVPEECRRYGIAWVLRFRTTEGPAQLLLDTRYQDAQALCRLSRALFPESADAEGPVRAAGLQGPDTIRPKV
jgi:hypothetical protein